MRHPISNLKNAAAGTLFKGWSVTPALKEGVHRRIARIEAGEEQAPSRPRAPRAPLWAAAAVAAACVVTAIGLQAERLAAPQAGAPSAGIPGTMPPPSYVQDTYSAEATRSRRVDGDGLKLKVQDASGSVNLYNEAETLSATGQTIAIPVREAQPGQKIIFQAEYTLRVKDPRSVMDQLQQMALDLGGYVADAVLNRSGPAGHAGRLVLRVPTSRYEAAVGSLKAYGDVRHERQWTQDVTSRYTDVEHRLRTLEAFEEQLRELAAKAANFDDWLRLSRQINETRIEIDNLKGQLKLLSNQVEYATITVSLEQVGPDDEPEGAGLGARSALAFHRSVSTLRSLAQSAVVGSAAAAPFAIPGGAAGLLLWYVLRRRFR